MKKKWFGIRISIGILAAFGWWGLLYPELALTPDTVKVIQISEDGESLSLSPEWSYGDDLYWDILNAGSDKITFRSKFLTDFNAIWEAFYDRSK